MGAPLHLGEALARALAEAPDVATAGRAALRLLGEAGGWRAGILWLDRDDGLLGAAATWGADEAGERYAANAERLAFPRGDGLPGRARDRDEVVWHDDLRSEEHFVRAGAAEDAAVRSAVYVPVTAAGGAGLGVLELAGDGPRPEDAAHAAELLTAARQLGQLVLRVRAEEGRRTAEELRGGIVAAALDCIVTADHLGRIIDFNPAAEATFGWTRAEALGRSVSDIVVAPHLREAHERAVHAWTADRESPVLGRRLELEGARKDGTVFPVELTVTRVGRVDPPVFAGFIRDVTERRRAEAELAELFEREHAARLRAETAERATKRIADALQRSLLPPHLPAIDGIELAATYRTGSDQADVGGDFYDVFALAPDRWGVVIGDVRGKGPEAAAITALARYTVRTAAVRERSPAAVLEVLNDALLRDTDTEAFCTVVYATLDLPGPRPRLCLSVAGHPPPLVVQADGEVRAPAVPGTLLGVVADPRLVETELELGPGDVLLLYTDGLTEARTEAGRLDVAGLTEVLAGTGGMSAAAVVHHVEDAVAARTRRFEDDVAVLAVRAAGAPVTTEATIDAARDTDGATETLALSLVAEPASIPAARRAVSRLAQRSLDPAACHRVATAVTEAATNAVLHAYRDGEAGAIDVTAKLEDGELLVLIEDAGAGMRPRDDSPGLGLGLDLIAGCADLVDIDERVDGGTSVRMRFRRAEPAGRGDAAP